VKMATSDSKLRGCLFSAKRVGTLSTLVYIFSTPYSCHLFWVRPLKRGCLNELVIGNLRLYAVKDMTLRVIRGNNLNSSSLSLEQGNIRV